MIVKLGMDYFKGNPIDKYLVIGKAACDGELNETSSGKRIGKVSVKAAEEKNGTAKWVTVTMWDSQSIYAASVRKGDAVLAVGNLKTREYNGKEYIDLNAEYINTCGNGAEMPSTNFAPAGEPVNIFTDMDDVGDELPF